MWRFSFSVFSSYLLIDQFGEYDFLGAVSDAVHSTHPLHLISGFQRFRDLLSCRHFRYKLKEHFLCAAVDLLQMDVQLSGHQQPGMTY